MFSLTRSTLLTRFLNQTTANSQAWPVGSMHRMRNGQRGLVVERWVWFTNADDATDVDWHADGPDEAHRRRTSRDCRSHSWTPSSSHSA